MEYALADGIATITFDDGKANAVGHSFLDGINAALDRAEADKAGAVILTGREGMFSAGFDLKEFEKGPEAGQKMVDRGFALLIRLYGYPLPLVAACSGHAIALGAFILMSCDSRIGAQGSFKLSLPETAIGMELTPLLVTLAAERIPAQHLTRAALQSEVYDPENAVGAGFLDEVVNPDQLEARALAVASKLAELPAGPYAANKLAIRGAALEAMKASSTVLKRQ